MIVSMFMIIMLTMIEITIMRTAMLLVMITNDELPLRYVVACDGARRLGLACGRRRSLMVASDGARQRLVWQQFHTLPLRRLL